MTDDEIQVVAEELAKAGGLSWYPGRPTGAFLRAISQDYLEHAKVAIAALDRMRASKPHVSIEQEATSAGSVSHPCPKFDTTDKLAVGAIVEYHPPRDKRAVTCRIEELKDGRARLKLLAKPDIGWVTLRIPLEAAAKGTPEEA